MVESSVLVGTALAVLAAVGWAGQYVCIRLGTERGRVSDAMVVALAVNVALVVPVAAVLHYPGYGLTPYAAAMFAAAGVAGSLLARVFQFKSTKAIGASRTAPVVSASALFASLLAVAFLGETLTAEHLVGVVLIVAGIGVISWETAGGTGTAGGRADSLDEAGGALAFPLLSAAFLGVEPLFLKWGLAAGTPPLVGLAVMSSAATLGFTGYTWWRTGLPDPATFGGDFKWYVGAGVGSTVALVAYFAALSRAPVVVVVPILQVAPLLVVAVSLVALPRRLERVTPRLVGAAVVVVAGTVIVSLYG